MSDDGARPTPDRHQTPRWVKISAIIALVLVVLLIGVLVFGGGQHGPGRHGGSDRTQHGGNHTAPDSGGQHGDHTSPGLLDSHPDRNTLVGGTLGNPMLDGDTYNRTVDDAGDVSYHCKVHSDDTMRATIQAQETHPTPDGRHR